MQDELVVLHLPAPIGWIGLTQSEIRTARVRAAVFADVKQGAQPLKDENGGAEGTKLLSAEDAARVLSVDPSWLLSRARANKIPHVRLGKYVRFDPVAIIEFGQRRKVDS